MHIHGKQNIHMTHNIFIMFYSYLQALLVEDVAISKEIYEHIIAQT